MLLLCPNTPQTENLQHAEHCENFVACTLLCALCCVHSRFNDGMVTHGNVYGTSMLLCTSSGQY